MIDYGFDDGLESPVPAPDGYHGPGDYADIPYEDEEYDADDVGEYSERMEYETDYEE